MMETLLSDAARIEALRMDMLFDNDHGFKQNQEAEQFYILALNSLDTAIRFMRLAAIKAKEEV